MLHGPRRHDGLPHPLPRRDEDRRGAGAGQPARSPRQLPPLRRGLLRRPSWRPTPACSRALREALDGHRRCATSCAAWPTATSPSSTPAWPPRATSSTRRRRTATTWPSGSTARARPASRRASCTSTTTSRSRARPSRARCSACARTTSSSRRPSSSTPTGWATASRSRCGSARPSVLMTGPTRPEPILATLREHRPTVFCSVPALYSAAGARGGADGGAGLRAPVRLGRRGAAAAHLRALAGALRPGDRRRHRLDRDAAHLLLQPARRRPAAGRRASRCRATSCASPTRTAACSRARPSATSRSAATRARPSTGTSTRRRSRACAATGSPPATATSAARTAPTSTSGRIDDMLKVGGLWVSPIDMEHVIVEHPRGRRPPAWSA